MPCCNFLFSKFHPVHRCQRVITTHKISDIPPPVESRVTSQCYTSSSFFYSPFTTIVSIVCSLHLLTLSIEPSLQACFGFRSRSICYVNLPSNFLLIEFRSDFSSVKTKSVPSLRDLFFCLMFPFSSFLPKVNRCNRKGWLVMSTTYLRYFRL